MPKKRDVPERPRVEPEIIPPGHTPRRSAWGTYNDPGIGGTHRIYITRLGPFGGALLMLIFAALAVVVLLAFVGALLIWVPLIAFIVLVAGLSGLWRLRR